MRETLINFDQLPYGALMRYPEQTKVLVVLSKHRNHTDDEPMSGVLCEFTEEPVGLGLRQSMYSHIAGDEGCPQMVYHITRGKQ